MQPSNAHGPELGGKLAEAVIALRNEPVNASLVAQSRCRALAIWEEGTGVEPSSSVSSRKWIVSLTAAAAILLIINLFQAFLRLPGADVEKAALRVGTTGDLYYHFSDLRIEPLIR
jgi:hypothetical protein